MAISPALASQFTEFLSDSNNYPPQLGAWIGNYLTVNPLNVPFSQIRGYADAVATANMKINAAASMADATPTAVSWTTVVYDTKALFSTGQVTRLTARTSGKWLCWGYLEFANNTTGVRRAQIRANGGTILSGQDTAASPGALTTYVSVMGFLTTTGGDYVELMAYQNSTAALSLNNASFSILRVSP